MKRLFTILIIVSTFFLTVSMSVKTSETEEIQDIIYEGALGVMEISEDGL